LLDFAQQSLDLVLLFDRSKLTVDIFASEFGAPSKTQPVASSDAEGQIIAGTICCGQRNLRRFRCGRERISPLADSI
jgi:hypothetical protein